MKVNSQPREETESGIKLVCHLLRLRTKLGAERERERERERENEREVYATVGRVLISMGWRDSIQTILHPSVVMFCTS